MNVFKRGLAALTSLSMCMAIGFQPLGTGFTKPAFSAAAADTVENGKCGENVNYEINSDGTLRIFGTGKMYNYEILGTDETESPFAGNKNVGKVLIEDGVTNIGNYLFYSSSIKSIEIPDSVTEIGTGAFLVVQTLHQLKFPKACLISKAVHFKLALI